MITANVHDAKTNLSKLLTKVAAGERVMITNRGTPVAELTKPGSQPSAKPKPSPGMFKDKIWIAPDFDDADAEVRKLFEENANKPL